MATKNNEPTKLVKGRTIVLDEGTTRGFKQTPTPYTSKVTASKPELARLVESFKVEARKLQTLYQVRNNRIKYEIQALKVMNIWGAIQKNAYWRTSGGEGLLAWQVIGKELLKQFKHGMVWDDYDQTEGGAANTFTSVEEQLAASTQKVYHKAKSMGIRNADQYNPEELAVMMHERQVYLMVDRLERQYDRQLQENPKVGTHHEQGRRRRQAEEFVESVGRMMDPIRDLKADVEYTRSILTYVCKTMDMTRLIVQNWKNKNADQRVKRMVDKAKRSHAQMHLVYVANNLLDMLQELGMYPQMKSLQEYDPKKAGTRHQSSTWKKKTPEEEAKAADPLKESIEYIDISSTEGDPEQELIQQEEDEDSLF